MTPHLKALFERCSGKGWILDAVFDNSFLDGEGFRRVRQCEKCGVHIRWTFKCIHREAPNDFIVVGSECVKSVVDGLNGPESIKFLRAKWSQRRNYFWKRFHGQVVITGERENGSWWTATGGSVTNASIWTFRESQRTEDEAKHYLMMFALNGYRPVTRVKPVATQRPVIQPSRPQRPRRQPMRTMLTSWYGR